MRMSKLAPAFIALALLPFAANAQNLPRVTVAKAEMVDFIGQVAITGTLVAHEEVMVNPLVSGRQITAIHADIGDTVTKGQVLAELDRETLEVTAAQARVEQQRAEAGVLQAQAQVDLAQVSLDSAQTSFNRETTLLSSGAITQTQFNQTETAFKTAQASLVAAEQGLAVSEALVEQAAIQLRLAELNLTYTRVIAPASGVISSRSASLGAVAASSADPMFRIIKDNRIELSTEVIETDIARITIGDAADLRIAGLGEVIGTVRLVSPRVDPRSRLGEIRISFPAELNLRIGVFANGWVTTEQYQSIGVPASAVLSDADGDYAQVVDVDGVVQKRRVETGLVWNDMREIRSGLEAGDTVILLAGAFFRQGDQILPVLENGATR